MSRFLHKFLRSESTAGSTRHQIIGVSSEGAAWIEREATGLNAWRYLAWDGASPKDALAMLFSESEYRQQSKYRLIFSPSVSHHWLQTPPSEVASLNELREVAQARCKQLFSVTSNDKPQSTQWSVSANWQHSKPFLCTAIPLAWAEAIDAHSNIAISSQDLIFAVFKHHEAVVPPSGWLALVVAHSLYIIQQKNRSPLSLRSLRLPVQAEMSYVLDLAKEEWAREMLRVESSAATLHCIYLRPIDQSCISPIGIELLSARSERHDLLTVIQPALQRLAATGSVLPELLIEAQLTAWCVEQFEVEGTL